VTPRYGHSPADPALNETSLLLGWNQGFNVELIRAAAALPVTLKS